MSRNPAWKQRERQVAKFFNAERTALSGGNSKGTRADVIHDKLFIEVKLREKFAAVTLWDQTRKLADMEQKVPIIALCEKNRKGFWIMVHSHVLRDGGAITDKIPLYKSDALCPHYDIAGKI